MTSWDENINEDALEEMESVLEKDIEEAEAAEAVLEKDILWEWKIRAELAELKNALARAQADYQNLIKRVERDKSDTRQYLTWDIILKILPIVDNLERIIQSTPEELRDNSLFEGTKSVLSWAIKAIESLWVKSFESVWTDFDAMYHDVMMEQKWEKWKVVSEFEKWYTLNDKVLRHAKVTTWNWELD